MNKTLQFPEGFWWGGASSGPQSEGWLGKRHENVMDTWYRKDRSAFFNQVGPDVASDFLHTYKDDLARMKEIGFNSFRTSIQWSRLIKDLETGEIDEEGARFYEDLIAEAKKRGIELVLNLHHFDLPTELLEKYGGWKSKHVVDLYVKFAKAAFERFGKDVKYWTTFNEPMVIPEAGWLYGFHYPNEAGKGEDATKILYNLNLASAKAIEAFHESVPDGKIGIILNLTPTYPASDSKEDQDAAHFADLYFNKSFLEPAVHGHFDPELEEILKQDGVLPEMSEEELAVIEKNAVDFLGVNYYHPKRAKAPEANIKEKYPKWMPDWYFEEYFWPEARINPYRGWEIYPQAMYEIAKEVQNHYGNIPWFISENGMGVENEEHFLDEQGNMQDDYRIDFYTEHLAHLHKAIEEGSNCFGFHVWTPFDCWSWNNAYKNRYGLIGVNLNDQSRFIKKSGRWFADMAKSNALQAGTDLMESLQPIQS